MRLSDGRWQKMAQTETNKVEGRRHECSGPCERRLSTGSVLAKVQVGRLRHSYSFSFRTSHLATTLLRGGHTTLTRRIVADKKVPTSYQLLSVNTSVLLPLFFFFFFLLIILCFPSAAPCPTSPLPPNAWAQPTAPRVKSPRPPSPRKSAMPMSTSYRRHLSLLLC